MNNLSKIDEGRAKIAFVFDKLKDLEQLHCPVVSRFTPGCYLRQITMPAKSYVIGKVHKTEHFNIILQGYVKVITATEGGLETNYYEAPHTFVSEAGVQKCVIMGEEDCIWQTVHVTDSTDLKEIEKQVIDKDYKALTVDEFMVEGDL